MTQKIASVGTEGRDKLVSGANYISDAVKTTLGPNGQNFALEKGNKVTNDGITIARELIGTQEDEIEERGAKMLVEAMGKVNDELNDGSTTMATLSGAILKDTVKMLPSKGLIVGKMSLTELLTKIDAEKNEIVQKLKDMAVPVTTEKQLVDVARASVEDETLAELIGKTQWELGEDGIILAEETNDKECSIEKTNGIHIDNGFGSSLIINNPEKEALELFDVSVLYTNHTVTNMAILEPIISALAQRGQKSIVIMARAFTEDAIRYCIKQMESGLGLYPLNAPYVDQAEIMQDLSAILGGRFIGTENNSLDSIQVSDIGFAKHVLAKRMSTLFTGDSTAERIGKRIETLEKKREGSGSEFEKKNLSTRIAQLKNGFATLKVGAGTDAQRKYLKDKADDAVNAVRLALQEGVVPGAGQALNTIADTLPDDYILKNAIRAPYEQITLTTGKREIPEWVVDSLKVTRIIVDRASSFAGILATAGGAVTTKRKKDCCKDHATP